MSQRHPSEADLALLAGGDCNWLRRAVLSRHVSRCGDCQDAVASFSDIRSTLREYPEPELDWHHLAAEMRGNIRVGIAAGECVRAPQVSGWRKPQLAIGLASVLLLAGAGVFLRGLLPHEATPGLVRAAVLESTGAGVEVRSGAGGSSMTLLNHGDSAGDQTVTSQGAIRASYVDGTTGTVTVTSVYVE